MSTIKKMEPVVMYFKKANGEVVELSLEKPEKPFSEAMKELIGDYPEVTIGFDCIPFRHGRVLKNVRVRKQISSEDKYTIFWESEESFIDEEE